MTAIMLKLCLIMIIVMIMSMIMVMVMVMVMVMLVVMVIVMIMIRFRLFAIIYCKINYLSESPVHYSQLLCLDQSFGKLRAAGLATDRPLKIGYKRDF